MLTYQIRSRTVLTDPLGQALKFPCEVRARLRLEPVTPFGGAAARGLTAVRGSKGQIGFDAFTGRTWIHPADPMQPVSVCSAFQDCAIQFDGNVCTLGFLCESPAQLYNRLEGFRIALPALLALDFVDIPAVRHISGTAGDVQFTWALVNAPRSGFDVVTTEKQEGRLEAACRRVELVSRGSPGSRRLFAAVRWFYVACRLGRVGHEPWEFVGEAVLNLAKVLEVLFPLSSDVGSIDAVRAGLRAMGTSDEEIERWYVPVLALRNHVDVAHVSLATLSSEDLELVQHFVNETEYAFRKLLVRVCTEIQEGRWEPPAYDDNGSGKTVETVMTKLRAVMTREPQAKP
jgi:hypothetical protein